MFRSRSLALITAAALTAALAPTALASAAAPARADPAKAEHDRVVAYWTPERMKAAKPRDFVRQKDGSFTLAPTPKALAGKAAAGKGKPGEGVVVQPPLAFPAEGVSTGEPWLAEVSTVDQRTGKVFFTSGASGYVCSGAVADDGGAAGRALVLTAGHCVYDESKYRRKAPDAGFVSNFLFVPDYVTSGFLAACTNAKQECWTAEALVVHHKYASAGGFNSTATKFDFGFAVVSGESELDSASRGSYVVDIKPSDGPTLAARLSAFGYPAASPYDGNKLTYCEGPIGQDARNANATWSMACNMTGGSSGGPWLAGMDLSSGGGGTLSSLNSYGYSGEPYMYGPKFNDYTEAVYQEAKSLATVSAPTNTRVG